MILQWLPTEGGRSHSDSQQSKVANQWKSANELSCSSYLWCYALLRLLSLENMGSFCSVHDEQQQQLCSNDEALNDLILETILPIKAASRMHNIYGNLVFSGFWYWGNVDLRSMTDQTSPPQIDNHLIIDDVCASSIYEWFTDGCAVCSACYLFASTFLSGPPDWWRCCFLCFGSQKDCRCCPLSLLQTAPLPRRRCPSS